MTILYVLVPVAMLLVIIAIWIFTWAVNNGQYDDLDSPAHSILFDDEDPAHLAAQKGDDQIAGSSKIDNAESGRPRPDDSSRS